jgi:hypothetical protein
MNKKIAISVSIIGVLLLYLLASNIKRSSGIPDLPQMKGSADEIIVTSGSGAVTLLKKEGKWTVGENGYPADAKVIGEIEKRFKEINVTDLISSKGYYAKYDLTPDKYIEVIIKKKGMIFRKFKIGKKSPTNRHTFIRIGDQPEIFLAEGTFDLVMNKSIDDFREREMLKIAPDTVSDITVEYQGRTFAFFRTAEKKAADKQAKKGGNVWGKWACRGYEGVQLDEARVGALLNPLNPLRAKSFPDTQKELMPPKVCMVKLKASSKEVQLTVFAKGDTYIASTSESPFAFGVEKWSIEKYFVTGIEAFSSPAKR